MAKITISLMRELEQKVTAGEISYSRMVEILNEQVLVDSSNASQQVSKATKDLTDEVERLKAENEHLRNRPRVNNGPLD